MVKTGPKAWYYKLKIALLEKRNTVSDSSLSVLGDSVIIVFILINVNDIVLTRSNAEYIHTLIKGFKSLGTKAYRNNRGLHLCQCKFRIWCFIMHLLHNIEAQLTLYIILQWPDRIYPLWWISWVTFFKQPSLLQGQTQVLRYIKDNFLGCLSNQPLFLQLRPFWCWMG